MGDNEASLPLSYKCLATLVPETRRKESIDRGTAPREADEDEYISIRLLVQGCGPHFASSNTRTRVRCFSDMLCAGNSVSPEQDKLAMMGVGRASRNDVLFLYLV